MKDRMMVIPGMEHKHGHDGKGWLLKTDIISEERYQLYSDLKCGQILERNCLTINHHGQSWSIPLRYLPDWKKNNSLCTATVACQSDMVCKKEFAFVSSNKSLVS